MMNSISVPLWLIIFIIGLPQFSETVYTPSLPDIAHSLHTSADKVEETLSIYLAGFAFGTFFWGIFSDKYGRRPCLIAGLIIYIFACFGCGLSSSIEELLFFRALQAFGGSTGSVLGQAISRDLFKGKKLGETYAIIGSALAFSPALGPLLGGAIDQILGWRIIFPFLSTMGAFLVLMVINQLPETAPQETRFQWGGILTTCRTMLLDKKLKCYCLLIAGFNGILFSYYAEGPFYFIELYGLSPSGYGLTFIGLALSAMVAGKIAKRMYSYLSHEAILSRGLLILISGACVFTATGLLTEYELTPQSVGLWLSMGSIMLIQAGGSMVITVSLSQALKGYHEVLGVASSLFGFAYYCLIALITLCMSACHLPSYIVMPSFFLVIAIGMCLTEKILRYTCDEETENLVAKAS